MEHQPIKSPVGKKNKQIWEAYQEVLEELKSKEEAPSTVSVAQAKKLGDAIKMASAIDTDTIVSNLEGLTDGLQDAKNTFNELQTAIDAKKNELKEVHKLEAEVNSLTAIIAAKDVLIAEREEKAAEILNKAKEDATETRSKADEESKRLIAEAEERARSMTALANEKSAADEKARKRVEEEWAYNFKRSGQQKQDEFNDRLNKAMKAIEEREEAVTEREANIDKLNAKIQELEKTIEINKDTETTRILEAVEEAKGKAKKSAAIEKAMVEKSYEAKLSIANARIEDQNGFISELRSRLDKAEGLVAASNERVTNIATASLKAGADAATISKVSEIAAGAGSKK